MLNVVAIESMKTKRSVIRHLLWLFPLLVIVIVGLFFSSTGYIVQSAINQWSWIWMPLFLATAIGLIDRHERKSTDYKIILSSPADLFNYELGRILHVTIFALIANILLALLITLISLLVETKVPLSACLLAIAGIFLTNLWQIPLYTWFSRLFSLYGTIALATIGWVTGSIIVDLPFGQVWPFSWSELFPVSLIQMHINGIPVKHNELVASSEWTIWASIILFVLFSYLAALSFKKQVTKNV